MKIAIMQPYLFPYAGYFQLINAVDQFVLYDDVQFIKGGWINRNYILLNNKKNLFSFGLKSSSTYACINQREFSEKFIEDKQSFLSKLKQAYQKAPCFNQVYDLIFKILDHKENNLSLFILNSLRQTSTYLGLQTKFLLSSEIIQQPELRSTDRVLHLLKILKCSSYVNAIGGEALYSKQEFKEQKIDLHFLKTKDISYPQFGPTFIPNLSIIDVLMFNEREQVKILLEQYELV